MNPKPKLLIFASGTKTGGGSGFQVLVEASRDGRLSADIVGVVSNHMQGGVRKRANTLDIPFYYMEKDWKPGHYKHFVQTSGAEWASLSGWLKPVVGLDLKTTFNIHPGPLTVAGRPDHFGGQGMYGHYVHEAVMAAYKEGEIHQSSVTMHFVTEEGYDDGPVFFRFPVPIEEEDDADSLATRVNRVEHAVQPLITDLVVRGHIYWDGKEPSSMRGYYGMMHKP